MIIHLYYLILILCFIKNVYIFRYSVSDHCNENQEKSDDIENW